MQLTRICRSHAWCSLVQEKASMSNAERRYCKRNGSHSTSRFLTPSLLLLLLLLPARVRELCIQRGEAWGGSLARSACSEQDYYEQLLATYQAWARVSPEQNAQSI